MPRTTAAQLETAAPHQAGTNSGVFTTSRQAGGALAIVGLGVPTAAPTGFRTGQLLGVVMTAVVAVAPVWQPRR
ncbi:hypothetical protein LVY72_23770 [Arthrobacter sp. I2-34]|uniref:MFS transporter n=1 Tax=Arthrobacter hankyongi TaxID=2904801 RepID=A0ABS9LE56_9MICC|nr:hypothetical protein [Arthrobacter hankyongi]MCG2624913.1 hypothetical protein [Arthrobacter hankyongi]